MAGQPHRTIRGGTCRLLTNVLSAAFSPFANPMRTLPRRMHFATNQRSDRRCSPSEGGTAQRLPSVAGTGTRPDGNDERAIGRALELIHANAFGPLCLSDMAQAACLSRFHFARMFRSHIGLSPMQYVRALRIEYAKSLLREGSNVAAIAAELGYFDQSHFSRAFRKVTGTTPGMYARRVRASATRPLALSDSHPSRQ